MEMPRGICEDCNEVFYATPGWFDVKGNHCPPCLGLPEDTIIIEDDKGDYSSPVLYEFDEEGNPIKLEGASQMYLGEKLEDEV